MELYISDLDGTLLNEDEKITEYSKKELNYILQENINFTVATARSPATVVDILNGVNIKLPVVLMNGVLLYDLKRESYINIESIKFDIVKDVLRIFEKYEKDPLVYGIKSDNLNVYHKEFVNKGEISFYNGRKDKRLKKFINVENYVESLNDSEIINFISFAEEETINNIASEIEKIEELSVNAYEDIYEKDYYFIEIYSKSASKANGIKMLNDYVNSDKLITFGDNINDIPMFEVSDECYAMENGADSLKKISTEVIGTNNEDAVTKKIRQLAKI